MAKVFSNGRFSDHQIVYIGSATGFPVSSVGDLITKTVGKDVAFISAFQTVADKSPKSLEDLQLRKQMVLHNYSNTDKLWDLLNEFSLKVITITGVYREREKDSRKETMRSDEKTFLVVNDRYTTEAFLKFILDAAGKFNQSSILFKSGKGCVCRGSALEAEVGYYIELSGGISRVGTIGKVVVEQWFSSNSKAIETTGYSELFGTQEPFMFTSSYHIHSIDFSNLLMSPAPSIAMSRHFTHDHYFSGKVNLDSILSNIVRMKLHTSE